MSIQLENNLTLERVISESFICENSLFSKLKSNFIKNKNLYSKEDLEKINECITKYLIKNFLNYFSILEKKFPSAKEVCEIIQNFILVSKYNLKRINSQNYNLITFCCSCASRKIPLKKKKKSVNNLTVKNSQNENLNKRKIKRINIDGCPFKLKFIYNQEGNFFSFKYSKFLIHNHLPNSNTEKVRYLIFLFFSPFFCNLFFSKKKTFYIIIYCYIIYFRNFQFFIKISNFQFLFFLIYSIILFIILKLIQKKFPLSKI